VSPKWAADQLIIRKARQTKLSHTNVGGWLGLRHLGEWLAYVASLAWRPALQVESWGTLSRAIKHGARIITRPMRLTCCSYVGHDCEIGPSPLFSLRKAANNNNCAKGKCLPRSSKCECPYITIHRHALSLPKSFRKQSSVLHTQAGMR